MTADIVLLSHFRRGDAGPAKVSTSQHLLTLFVTLPDPLPKDWGEFWNVTDFWWRPQAIATRPSPETWRWI
jgi:hypothetical protein